MLTDGPRLDATSGHKSRTCPAFYSEKLGLEPVEERPGGLRYQSGGASFALFQSAGSASGTHTQMAWAVDDIEATVAALRHRGWFSRKEDLPPTEMERRGNARLSRLG
jgi:hypothetical protein